MNWNKIRCSNNNYVKKIIKLIYKRSETTANGVNGGLGYKLFEEWRIHRGEHSISTKKEIEVESKQY